MNERIEHCLYQSGLTAQGCWDELDDYAKQGIEKFAELIVQECAELVKDGVIEQHAGDKNTYTSVSAADTILEHFGVEE